MIKMLTAVAIAAALLTGPAMAKSSVAKHAVKAPAHHHALKKTSTHRKHRQHPMAKHAMHPMHPTHPAHPMHGASLPNGTTRGGGGN